MDHLEHCDLLEGEVERFAALVETAPRSMPVPSCPGWSMILEVWFLKRASSRWVTTLARLVLPRLHRRPGDWMDRRPRFSQTLAWTTPSLQPAIPEK